MTMSGMTFTMAGASDWDYVLDRMVSTYYETAKWPAHKARPEQDVRQEMRFYVTHERASDGLAQFITDRRENSEALIAWDQDGTRAGCVLMRMQAEAGKKVAWIYLVYVEPMQRRKGLAKELMARAETWARERGAHSMMLSVAAWEKASVRLYESVGMEPEKVFMRKWL